MRSVGLNLTRNTNNSNNNTVFKVGRRGLVNLLVFSSVQLYVNSTRLKMVIFGNFCITQLEFSITNRYSLGLIVILVDLQSNLI